MKNTIFSTLVLVSTLSACSDFESSEHHNPELSPTVEQTTDYALFDVSSGNSVDLQESAYVMDLEPLGLAVYEIDPRTEVEADPQWAGYDNKISLERLKDLDMDNSQLWYELSSQRGLVVGYVGAAPENMLALSADIGHKVMAFQESDGAIYESELVKGIVESLEEEVDYIYVPVAKADAPDTLLKAVDLAEEEGVRIFDRMGTQF